MPNNPLKTFRTVEPANYGFGSSATLASRPFVLYHQINSIDTTGTVDTAADVPAWATTHVNRTSKCIPWLIRNEDEIYPVAIPNAYDRVYIFPMYVVEQSVARTAADYIQLGIQEGASSLYIAPLIFPFGRFPETQGLSTVGKLDPNQHRIPDDLIALNQLNASGSPLNTRANGLWTVLPPYATNFTTGNSTNVTSNEANPASVARIQTTAANSVIGTGYRLPPDLSISSTTAAALVTGAAGSAHAKYAAGTASTGFTTEGVVIGTGIEYQTMGCDELVVSPQNLPVKLRYTPRGATAGVAARVHWFLMGVFLG
jgi:hypothetical protein